MVLAEYTLAVPPIFFYSHGILFGDVKVENRCYRANFVFDAVLFHNGKRAKHFHFVFLPGESSQNRVPHS